MDKKITIQGKVALVSGSNRGMGRTCTIELLNRGASKVYAGARDINSLNDLKEKYDERLVPTQLDVTNDLDIENISKKCKDVNILVNNAGVLFPEGFLKENLFDSVKKHYDVMCLEL